MKNLKLYSVIIAIIFFSGCTNTTPTKEDIAKKLK